MTDFTPGLQLAGRFYRQAVRPILNEDFPGLRYAAALIGIGSEVLGFDTAMSMDHDWGPRLMLFLEPEAEPDLHERIKTTLRRRLPSEFDGHPTGFQRHDSGSLVPDEPQAGAVNHRVVTWTAPAFFWDYLGFDIRQPIEPVDWLTFPEQKLRALASGAVYHDKVGLQEVRQRFHYYPQDVWLYLLACAWNRIGQEEHLMGRAGYVGDEAGSAIIGARLARDLMRLGFLMEKQYAPYPKWFGTAFARLACSQSLIPCLEGALHAAGWQERQQFLVQAYEIAAGMHNALGITDPLPAQVYPFYERPFLVIGGEHYAAAIAGRIRDPALRRLLDLPLIGGLDQFSDSTDLLSNAGWRQALRRLYEDGWTAGGE